MKMIRRLTARFAAVTVFLAAALSMTTVPARAALADCPYGQFCWWQNSNFTGGWGHRTWSNIWGLPNHCWSMGAAGNTMSSLYNYGTNSTFRLWDAGNCTGTGPIGQFPYYVSPNEVTSFTFGGSIYNDQVGGVQWVS